MKIFTVPRNTDAVALTAKLVKDLPRDIDKKIYVFCESKATLSYEREIAAQIGGTFNTEVLSFSRYLSKKVKVSNYLGKAQGALLVRKLIKENKKSLLRLKSEAFSLPGNVYELISQLKSAIISPDDLTKILAEEKGAFGSKLNDIAKIYALYEQYITKNNLTDESNYLALTPSVIKNDDDLKGASVIVSGIPSFTKQTLGILKALKEVSDLNFVCVAADYPAFTNESVNKISDLFPWADIRPEKESSEVAYRIGKFLFDPSVYTKKGVFSDKIKITEAISVKDECDRIAARIRYEVVNNNLRYKDFSVILSDVESFTPYLKESFYLYDIPFYKDENKSLDKHPIIGLIGRLIDFKRFNYAPQKAINAAMSGIGFSQEESVAFTDYIYKNAVSRKQIKQPFSDLVAESVRNKLVTAADKLGSKDSVYNYVLAVKEIVLYLNIEQRCKNISDLLKLAGEADTAEFNDGAIAALYNYLEQMIAILGDTVVTLNEFKNMVISGAAAVNISTLPQYNDRVFVGDYKAGRMRKSKILFMPQLNFDVPVSRSDAALLNDRELTKMEGYKLIIEPKMQIVNDRERENLVVSMMGFTDKLYLSYSLISTDGKPVLKSRIIDMMINLFSDDNNAIKIDKCYNTPLMLSGNLSTLNFMTYKSGLEYSAKRIREFRNSKTDDIADVSDFLSLISSDDEQKKILTKKEDIKLFRDELKYSDKFSATTIENYFSCPYKAFGKNVLKLQESETGDARVNEIGNIIHNVLEKFIKKFDSVKDLSSAYNLSETLFDEEIKMPVYARYLNKSVYKNIFADLKEEIKKECGKVYSDLLLSDFKPYGAEIEFNESGKNGFKPIYIDIGTKKVALRGKIDRADCYETDNQKYFRIIDYKSGVVDDSDYKFYCGTKIQLYLYMNVFTKRGYKPAAAHYMKLSDDYSANPSTGAEYYGKVLADENILNKLDKNFAQTGESSNFGVKLKKGSFVGSGSLLDADQFDKYVKYAEDVAKSGIREMANGLFLPSPIDGGCEYCQFKGLCGYDDESGDFNRDVTRSDKQSIIAAEEDV